jgi:hypothetical protein
MVGGHSFDDFRSEIIHGARSIARGAERRRVRNGQAEVDEFQNPFVVHHDISWAKIPVEIFGIVEVLDGITQLAEDIDLVAFQLGAFCFHQVVQPQALDPFHHQVLFAIGGDAVVKRFDAIGVFQGLADFPFEWFFETNGGKPFVKLFGFDFVQEFQTDITAEFFVIRFENFGHTSLAGAALEVKPFGNVDLFQTFGAGATAPLATEETAEKTHGVYPVYG